MHPTVEKLISHEYAAQRSEEWLKLRGNMLTASDAATAIGVNPYEKPEDLILKKCGHKKFDGNQATFHGNKFEDEARDIYCEKYNEVSHEIGLYPHPTIKWLGGSPDGITESGKLVEIKCPLRRKITPEVPVYYMPQLQLLMEILDLEEAVFIQYKPAELTWPNPSEFCVTEVKRDRDWFTTQLPVMDALWKRVIWHREHGVEDLLKAKNTKKRGPRKKIPDASEPEQCKIVEYDEDAFNQSAHTES
jgi:putative phage-type endonuclease